MADHVAEAADAWLRGEADLWWAGVGKCVPLRVQLGVLAHTDLERLQALGRYRRRGSVRRAWGTEMASLAGDLARHAGSAEELRRIQRTCLVPLELDVLDGRVVLRNREDAAALLRLVIGLAES